MSIDSDIRELFDRIRALEAEPVLLDVIRFNIDNQGGWLEVTSNDSFETPFGIGNDAGVWIADTSGEGITLNAGYVPGIGLGNGINLLTGDELRIAATDMTATVINDLIMGGGALAQIGSGSNGDFTASSLGAVVSQQGGAGRPTRVVLNSFDDSESEVYIQAIDNLNPPTPGSGGAALDLYAGTTVFPTPGVRALLPVAGVFEIIDSSNNPILRVTGTVGAPLFEIPIGSAWTATL